jgi:hypothetical protein
VNRHISALALAVVLAARGTAIERYSRRVPLTTGPTLQGASRISQADVAIDLAHEPMWAYGFDRTPAPGGHRRPLTRSRPMAASSGR